VQPSSMLSQGAAEYWRDHTHSATVQCGLVRLMPNFWHTIDVAQRA
jgi:hypothetical protein